MIYLDNSATTVVRPEVREAMLPFLEDSFGNPSSVHKLGRAARQAIDTAREQVAGLLKCRTTEVFFSPCATYSNNVAILGRARHVEANGGGRHLITCNIEHPACLGPAKFLEANGWTVTYLRVDSQGLISIDELRKAITKETSMVSLMWANNEIGCLQPIHEIAQVCRDAGLFFHTDAVQVPGKLALDMDELAADTLSLSGHKFYAPKGIGILYKREGCELQPIFFGGGQEGALFPGTEALGNIVGIGKAAELAAAELTKVQPKLRRMQAIITEGLCALEGVRMTGPSDPEKRLPGHVSVVIARAEGEALVMQCDLKGLCVSSASACHKGIMQPSHVVSALGVSDELAMGSLRVTAGRFNTEEECRRAMEVLKKVVNSLRKDKAVNVR
jgi:cysteine desulfurase